MAVTLLDAFKRMPLVEIPHPIDGPDLPLTPYKGGLTWACDTGRHRYHRNGRKAKRCAFEALPMISVAGAG